MHSSSASIYGPAAIAASTTVCLDRRQLHNCDQLGMHAYIVGAAVVSRWLIGNHPGWGLGWVPAVQDNCLDRQQLIRGKLLTIDGEHFIEAMNAASPSNAPASTTLPPHPTSPTSSSREPTPPSLCISLMPDGL